MNKIPNNLKEYRLKAGLIQMEVAKALGFTSNERISRWEKGEGFPSIVNAIKMSLLFGKSVNEMYSDQNSS